MFKKIIDNIKLFFSPIIKYFTSKTKTNDDLNDEEMVFINKESINLEDY